MITKTAIIQTYDNKNNLREIKAVVDFYENGKSWKQSKVCATIDEAQAFLAPYPNMTL